MKILQLRFKNLNSLYGEWTIDFTLPDYTSEGIFAITGPTGSGKSTVLDALCLALYGETPRLGKIKGSSNELLSRQAGECFAEVLFETDSGRYRSHWAQHRSRKKPDGELQLARHEVSDDRTGKIMASKLLESASAIERLTGMDFDRFTRSMLLAQGGFAAFLQTSADNRAPVLEQITGTGIYSEISIKVHERNRQELLKKQLLADECAGVTLLSLEEGAELSLKLQEALEGERHLLHTASESERALEWLQKIAVMQEELMALDQNFLELQAATEEFAPERARLERAERAATLEGRYNTIQALQLQQEREVASLAAAEGDCRERIAVQEEAQGVLSEQEQRLLGLREREKEQALVFQEVRALELQIAEKRKLSGALQAEVELLQERLEMRERQVEQALLERKEAERVFREAEAYQKLHHPDGALAGAMSGIEMRLRALHSAIAAEGAALLQVDQARQRLDQATLHHERLSAECSRVEGAFASVQLQHNELLQRLGELLGGTTLRLCRNEYEQVSAEARELETLSAALKALEELRREASGCHSATLALFGQCSSNKVELPRLASEQERRAEGVRMLEAQVVLQERIRSLEDERSRLQDNTPCPLCGSLHHPYGAATLPVLDETQKELLLARSLLRQSEQRLTALQIEGAAREKELQQQQELLAGLTRRIAQSTLTISDVARRAGLPESEVVTPELLHERIELADARCRELSVRIGEAEALEERISAAADEATTLQQALSEAHRQREEGLYLLKDARKELQRAEDAVRRARTAREELASGVLGELAVFGISDPFQIGLDETLSLLQLRLHLWQEEAEKKSAAEQQLRLLEHALLSHAELLQSQRHDLAEKKQLFDEETLMLDTLKTRRRELFGEARVEEEEARLQALLLSAEERLHKARLACDQARQQQEKLETVIAHLSNTIHRRSEELALLRHSFMLGVQERGFSDTPDFLAARLEPFERERLLEQATAIKEKRLQLETLRRERMERVEQERGRALSLKTAEELSEELAGFSEQLRTLRSSIAGMEHRIAANEKAAGELRQKAAALTLQQAECARWGKLHELIGSGDGKKYRNFAQGLTFEIMVDHANRQLRKMSDRYLLVHDPLQPLELNVIDNYQAGERRSAKNLSGGESFLVSLALALGLSQMSSRKVRVDSLFLDEGFGTLDEEALETALEALSGVQQSGKLIGIISHVAALRERITTQIQVEPVSGGKSRLSGAGISFV